MTLCARCTRTCKDEGYIGQCKNFLSIHAWMDHMALLSWIGYSAHKCAVNKTVVNFDEREAIVLPSGRRIKLTITVEELK